jgi:hypothetical protein
MVRAPHLTQVFFFADKLPVDVMGRHLRTRASQEQRRMADRLDGMEGMLPMEYARLGDLNTWLKRLAGADNHLPPEALWRIFDCLVKACKAMEWPPYLRSPGMRSGRYLTEDILYNRPGVPGAVPEPDDDQHPTIGLAGYVHFDLDPKNSKSLNSSAPSYCSSRI